MRSYLRLLPLLLLLSACTQNAATDVTIQVTSPAATANNTSATSTASATPDLATPAPPVAAPVEENAGSAPVSEAPASSSVIIQSALSQLVLAVVDSHVEQQPADGADAQKWLKEDQPDGTFLIQTLDGSRCLDSAGGAANGEGNLVQVKPCDGSAGQLWSSSACEASSEWACFTPGSFWLKSASGRVLDLPGDSTAVGEKINTLGFAHGGKNQQWYILAGE